ncbi:MAG: GNAT family N-acetyltransferase [Oscillospiraceae bacterium]|nr:GNAT family N-acetyltransferase [Oscillospiraceae bacterium]
MEYYIRPVKKEDAEGMSALRRMPGVFETILGNPAERLDKAEQFLANLDGNTFQFVAVLPEEDGREQVIGSAGLTVKANPRTRHVGAVGIMVHRDWQGRGVGTQLMETVLDMADNWLMLVRVELTAFVDNAPAIRLYEKMGFVIEGRSRAAAIRQGKYEDEYLMARIRLPQAGE